MNYTKFSNDFDFTVKTDLKELEDNDNLTFYSIDLDAEIRHSKIVIENDRKPILFEHLNNTTLYSLLNEYSKRIKLIEKQKEYLKVLEERETELNEYLEEVIKKMREDLKL